MQSRGSSEVDRSRTSRKKSSGWYTATWVTTLAAGLWAHLGTSTEKTDFAIPTKEDPAILIEVKGYGATGSQQTDISGDIEKIDLQKRRDTHLLLVTDGLIWKDRLNDLRKLIQMQNQGKISRIYTRNMRDELEADLRQLRKDHSL